MAGRHPALSQRAAQFHSVSSALLRRQGALQGVYADLHNHWRQGRWQPGPRAATRAGAAGAAAPSALQAGCRPAALVSAALPAAVGGSIARFWTSYLADVGTPRGLDTLGSQSGKTRSKQFGGTVSLRSLRTPLRTKEIYVFVIAAHLGTALPARLGHNSRLPRCACHQRASWGHWGAVGSFRIASPSSIHPTRLLTSRIDITC